MKARAFVGFSLGLALALTVPVGASATTTTAVDPASLGIADAMLNFCSSLDPGGAARYSQLKISIFGQLSAVSHAALARTTQYREGFDGKRGWLRSLPKDQVRQSCLALIAPAQTG